jgi:hypothetical protein
MSKTNPEQNKALVLEAFDTLFNKRDYATAERYWSDRYIQHSAHIAPGRNGLFNLIRTLPGTLKYENQLIVAEGDYVIAHGRFSGNGRRAAWSPLTSSASRMANSLSIGTCFRTRRPRPNPSAGCRCSATASPTSFCSGGLAGSRRKCLQWPRPRDVRFTPESGPTRAAGSGGPLLLSTFSC